MGYVNTESERSSQFDSDMCLSTYQRAWPAVHLCHCLDVFSDCLIYFTVKHTYKEIQAALKIFPSRDIFTYFWGKVSHVKDSNHMPQIHTSYVKFSVT